MEGDIWKYTVGSFVVSATGEPYQCLVPRSWRGKGCRAGTVLHDEELLPTPEHPSLSHRVGHRN